MTTERFTHWVRRRLVPRLRPGDIVPLDNLRAYLHLPWPTRCAAPAPD